MELFSKIYNCYFTVVEQILAEAEKKPLTAGDIRQLCDRYGFEESSLIIAPKLLEGVWPVLKRTADGYCPALRRSFRLPMTLLQKSWLKALLTDERIRLFFKEKELEGLDAQLGDVEPLFCQTDFYYYDRCDNGDPFASGRYQAHFRILLAAAENRTGLSLCYENSRGRESSMLYYPRDLEYSQKDNKFRTNGLRVFDSGNSRAVTLNLARIKSCEPCGVPGPSVPSSSSPAGRRAPEPVRIEISGERNSLERCMLHFASYEKKTEYIEERDVYQCTIYYDGQDETELLTELLSFGPVIRILGPPSFLDQVKARVARQYRLLHDPIPNGDPVQSD